MHRIWDNLLTVCIQWAGSAASAACEIESQLQKNINAGCSVFFLFFVGGSLFRFHRHRPYHPTENDRPKTVPFLCTQTLGANPRSDQTIGLMNRVFRNSLGDWGSIPSRVIPKIQKMVFDAALLNTPHYKVRIKGKVEKSREWSSSLPYTSV